MLRYFMQVVGRSKERRFWNWFTRNEGRLFQFEADQDAIFADLGSQLRTVHPDLVFEFGPVLGDGKRDFVVSADGLLRVFPAVESLVAEAPALERWSWVKFRQRGKPHVEMSFADIAVNFDTACYAMLPRGDHVDVTILFESYNEDSRPLYEQIAFLILDHLLGEFDVVTRVAQVDVAPSSADLTQCKPLSDLPAEFDAYMAKQRKSYH